MHQSLLTIAIRSIRRAGMRSVLYLIVGAIVGLGLQAPVLAANVRQSEADRLGTLEAMPLDPQARGVIHHFGDNSVLLLQFPVHSGPPPPGMSRSLRAGEAWVSPALLRRIQAEEYLASWFRRYRVMHLPFDATASAGELKAYLADDGRVGPSYLSGTPLVSLPASPIGSYQLIGFGLFGLMPAAAMLLVASRFGHELRSRRLRALRTIGVSQRSARMLLGLELALPMSLGCLLALAAPRLFVNASISVPLVHRAFYASDSFLSPFQLMLVFLVTGAGAFTVGSQLRAETVSGRRYFAYLASMPFALGVLLTILTWLKPRPNDPARTAAVILLAAGLPRAVELGASLLARGLGHLRLGPIWLIVTRGTSVEPRAAGRLAGLVAAGLFASFVAGPVAAATTSSSPQWAKAARTAGQSTMLVRADSLDGSRFPATAVPAQMLPVAGLWLPGSGPPAPPAATALVATCSQIEELIDPTVTGCTGKPQLVRNPERTTITGMRLFGASQRSTIEMPATTSEISLRNDDALGFEPTAILPPALAIAGGEPLYLTNLFGQVTAQVQDFERVQSSVVGAAPGYRVESAFTAVYQPDSTVAWIILGEIIVVAIILLSGLLGALSDRTSRQSTSTLLVAGFSHRMTVVARLAAVAL